tara:strand:+ start:120 stop:1013 length:894 start_codon:yes stop_codon:yes gene_type:complete
MPKRVLVTGKDGQLGKSIEQIAQQYPQYDFEFVGRERLDLSSAENINEFFVGKHFDVIINCAAYTAVDKAETETDLADKINHLAVKQLAEISTQQESVLIHISTDYVFNGQKFKPYIESDLTEPQSIYGATKLKGEQTIQQINPKGCIIRTSWVYSEYGNNFVKTMLRLGHERDSLNVIFDQVGTPTYAGDLAKTILQMVDGGHSRLSIQNFKFCNVYHYSNEGVCSWYDFAKTVFELSNIDCRVSPIETKDYPTAAQRPHYSLLNKAKIKHDFELEIPYWKDSLQKCIHKLQGQCK